MPLIRGKQVTRHVPAGHPYTAVDRNSAATTVSVARLHSGRAPTVRLCGGEDTRRQCDSGGNAMRRKAWATSGDLEAWESGRCGRGATCS